MKKIIRAEYGSEGEAWSSLLRDRKLRTRDVIQITQKDESLLEFEVYNEPGKEQSFELKHIWVEKYDGGRRHLMECMMTGLPDKIIKCLDESKMKIITKMEYERPVTDLKAMAESRSLKSGDIIPITLKDGRDLELEVGRDESGKTFLVFHDILEYHRMNKGWTNEGGWEACELRGYANKEFFELLPDWLQAIIVPTKIVQIWDGKRHETMDKLFCLSETQVFGQNGWDGGEQDPEDTQLDIFKDRRGRIKNYNGSASYWWLRSAYDGSYFRMVYVNGIESVSGASNAYGLVLGFTI